MVNVAAARDVLFGRMGKVMSEEVLHGLYPDAIVPKVYLGFPKDEPPFYVAVDEVADNIATTGAVSMGHAEFTFDLHVWMLANHKDLKTASNTLLAYIEAAAASILADQQLDYTVDFATPSVNEIGTAADSSKRYVAAAYMTVSCKVSSVCPAEIKEAIQDAGRNA